MKNPTRIICSFGPAVDMGIHAVPGGFQVPPGHGDRVIVLDVVLIRPFMKSYERDYSLTCLDKYSLCAPPLSLLSISAYLEKNGMDFSIIDMEMDYGIPFTPAAERAQIKKVLNRISSDSPGWVGISALAPHQGEAALDIAESLKNEGDRTPVIMGGYLSSSHWDDILETSGAVDGIGIGDGESLAVEISRNLANGLEFHHGVKSGMAFRKGGNAVRKPLSKTLEMKAIPPIDLNHLNRPQRYPVAVYNTSTGCPFRCNFCVEGSIRMAHRHKSPQKIRIELDHIHDTLKTNDLGLTDPLFGIRPRLAKRVCDMFSDYDYSFAFESRVDVFPPELTKDLKKAGAYDMVMGLESADFSTLLGLGKLKSKNQYRSYLKKARKLVEGLLKNDISPSMYFLVGCPGEHKDSMKRTERFARTIEKSYEHATTQAGTDPGIHFIPSRLKILKGSPYHANIQELRSSGTTFFTENPMATECGTGRELFSYPVVKDPSVEVRSWEVDRCIERISSLSRISDDFIERYCRKSLARHRITRECERMPEGGTLPLISVYARMNEGCVHTGNRP